MADSDDPFLPSSLPSRPRPGAGRRGTPEPTAPFQRGSGNLADFEPIPPSARAFLGLGLNPLVATNNPVVGDIASGFLRLTLPKNPNATDVTFYAEVTGQVTGPWTTNGPGTRDQGRRTL